MAGCAWTVVQPEPSPPLETVYVSQYGWHTRLALPNREGDHYIEYGFGDWRYYALGEENLSNGVSALFFSDTATFSRREIPAHHAGDPEAGFSSKRTAALEVSAHAVDDLRGNLESTWNELENSTVRRGDLSFRKVGWDYSLFHNSNHQTAEWLRELECEIEGVPLLGDFRVERE